MSVSLSVFPDLPGLGWSVGKQPEFSTLVKTAVNGAETRISNWAYPRWRFKLVYELLRDRASASGASELKQLMGFFLSQQGQGGEFLFRDPSDCTTTDQTLGTGDGTTTSFALLRGFGGFIEPVGAADQLTGWSGGPNGAMNDTGSGELELGGLHISDDVATLMTAPELTGWVVASPDSGLPPVNGSIVTLNAGQAVTLGLLCEQSARTSATVMLWPVATPEQAVTVVAHLDSGSVTVSGGGLAGMLTAGLRDAGNGWAWLELGLTAATAGDWTWWSDGAKAPLVSHNSQSPTTDPLGRVPMLVRLNGTTLVWGHHWTLSDDRRSVLFATAPPAGARVSADFSFFYRVRFAADVADFSQFAKDLWELRQIELVSVK